MKFEEIIKAIEEAPLSQILAIMIIAVKEAKRGNIFVSDEKMKSVVSKIIDDVNLNG